MRINRTVAVAAAAGVLAMTLAGRASATPPANKVLQDADSTGISLAVDALTPTVPKPNDTLTVAGTVTNTSDDDIDGFGVELRIAYDPVSTRTQVARISSGDETPNTRGVTDGLNLVDSRLAPGESAPWSIDVPMANLGLGRTGVYGLRVDTFADDNSEQRDSTQTFLPWFPNPKEVKPTKLVWLWPLTNTPNQNANLVFLNQNTPQDLLPDGRLSRLLDTGLSAGAQVEWVVDPQLLAAVNGMTDGYQVAGPEGAVIAGGSPQPAVDWLVKARAGLKTASVAASEYAFPDVTALTRAKMTQEVVQATTASTEAVGVLLERPVTTGLAWPPGARTDAKTLTLLQKSGVRTVVLDRAALQPADGASNDISSAVIRTESGPLAAVLTDRALSASLGSAGSSSADALLDRQRFMAETGVLTATAPTTNRILAVGPDPRWNPNSAVTLELLAALRTSPFMRSASLAQLLADTPKDVPRALAPMTAASRRAALSPNYLDRIKATQEQLEVFSSILNEPGELTEKYSTALLRATSGAWRTDRPGGNELLDSVNDELNADMGRVRALSGGVKSFSSESGEIPITISNDLPVPVTVGMTLTGDPPIRLTAQKFAPIVIPANRKVSTQITAQVRGNGELPVKVQLTNQAGAPYGEPTEVILRSSAYASAATWVVVIAFALLALLLLANSVRRRRQLRADANSAGPSDTEDSAAATRPADE